MTREAGTLRAGVPAPGRAVVGPGAPAGSGLEVVRAGALTTVQDAGRTGWAHLGVPRAGALDGPARCLANRLVGNAPDAAVLETTLTGCAVRVSGVRPLTAVVGGAVCGVTVDGRPVAWGAPVRVPPGAVLEAGPALHGLRSYLAFGGGLVPEPVLGSRSADLLSGLGPPVLRDGDVLPVGAVAPGHSCPAAGPVPWPGAPAELVLPVHPGPRDDWFTPAALRTLTTAVYRVAAQSNRIGLRTEGPFLARARGGELPSEGMVLGAVQVPPDGRPVVFLNDHPTTGGYPVVGVVAASALAAAAQAPPGTPVRFVRA
ncbi:5-oxoprolinase subunit C family protein [Streptomyces salyersiae]|uniref:Biotin-dependent carboxyltransferase family protein n=1 Tax=Streptomyces salyersiae TaxID=3075530 RepID=A0ABU2RHV2_9ACTN|nr:biotin-dependent carboxyltransferase family protein [Streptomyces sp. DSM 41770]MDT0428442.1 biotin-dependent carboxyltransferase family protein [Streptomyces sp. DSM 41770]